MINISDKRVNHGTLLPTKLNVYLIRYGYSIMHAWLTERFNWLNEPNAILQNCELPYFGADTNLSL